MLATDAIAELTAHFPLERVGLDLAENPEYDFGGGFAFTATVLDEGTVQLCASIPGFEGRPPAALRRRLLEAGLSGAETGAGQFGLHPTLGLGLIEVVDCTPLATEDFRLRVVDFLLHGEYWRSDGAARLLAGTAAPAALPDALTFRL